jgi:hypothetical protein
VSERLISDSVDEAGKQGYESPDELRDAEPEEFARVAEEEFSAQDAINGRAANEQVAGVLPNGANAASADGKSEGSGGGSRFIPNT